MATKVLDIDLCRPWQDTIAGCPGYDTALALIRFQQRPLGQISLPVSEGRISYAQLWQCALEAFGRRLQIAVLEYLIPDSCSRKTGDGCAPCAVIVCTRDRPTDLRQCLDSLVAASPRAAEIIVVDNAPSDDRTKRLTAEYPVRYVRETRRGLNWARSRGAREARADLILYTDDDVVVDPGWIGAMCDPFADPTIGAVTGLVLALELETPAQEAFERFTGFSRGFEERRFTAANLPPPAGGKAGAGASMAFRRETALQLRIFEAELDCGTAALSGGDNYAFYRMLKHGHAIRYTSMAICWHRHRRTERELLTTLYGYSVGVYAFLLRCIADHGDWEALRVGMSWFFGHHLRNLVRAAARKPGAAPLRYTIAEIRGALASYPAYRRSRRAETGGAQAAGIRHKQWRRG